MGVDEVCIKLSGMGDGLVDGLLGDLVEHHATHRHLRLELVKQMPGDGLPLAVTIGSEQELVRVLEQALEFADRRPLFWGNDVDRGELVIDVDSGTRPWLPFVLGGNLGCAGGQVAHVTLTGSHGVLGPQVPGDHRGLMGGLDDDEALGR
ncbi:MAG: flagellar basal body rod protein [Cutibacterium acnes]|nr:flagellar basal body rod protein [Cutibacterium acnes]